MNNLAYSKLVFLLILSCSICYFSAVHASVFGEPVLMAEPDYLGAIQHSPSLAFDPDGNLNMAWSDNRNGPSQIFYKLRYSTGEALDSFRVDQENGCSTFNCDLNQPLLGMASNPGDGYLVFGSLTSFLDLAMKSFAYTYPGNPIVTDRPDADSGVGGPHSDYAIVTWINNLFVAHMLDSGVIRIARFNSTTETWDSTFTITPGPDSIFSNVDIARDDQGYLYLVFDEYDFLSGTHYVKACRSINPGNVSSGFAGHRDVMPPHNYDEYGHPAIQAQGDSSSSDLLVVVAWINSIADQPFVYAICERNGAWLSTPAPLVGFASQACSWSSGINKNPDSLDVTFGNTSSIYVVWGDTRTPEYEIYGAVSHNLCADFMPDQLISDNGPVGSATSSSIVYDDNYGIAVSFERTDAADRPHAYFTVNDNHFNDACNSSLFENWDNHAGVIVNTAMGHEELGCYQMQILGTRGILIKSFPLSQTTGSVDFWFYDTSAWVGTDFYFRIRSDDGSKTGIYRMLGINNATTSTNYSVYDGSNWVDMARTRTTAWHHVTIDVGVSGINIYLDPESYATPVLSDSQFTWFDEIAFYGGSNTNPYFVDDITVNAEIFYIVPAIGWPGLTALICIFSLFMRRIIRGRHR